MYGITTITPKGQTTIPEELRTLLAIQPGDKALYQQADPSTKKYVVQVISSKNVVNDLFGSLNPDGKIKYVPLSVVREKAGFSLGRYYERKAKLATRKK